MERAAYLALLILFAGVPLWIALRASRTARTLRVLGSAVLVSGSIGWAWDAVGTWDGVWTFPESLDLRWLGLPLEEYAFVTLCPLSIAAMTLAFVEHERVR